MRFNLGSQQICLWFYLFTASTTCVAASYRLDWNVLPTAYDITIKTYLLDADGAQQFTFDGEVAITLHATQNNVTNITLHKDYIDILNATLYDEAGALLESVPLTRLTYDGPTDKLTVPLKSSMNSNQNYTLRFVYKGQIRNGLAGVFRANYTNAEGKNDWYAITQLQRIDARTAFPCFDEPGFKAKFRMHINRQQPHNSRFNTRLINTERLGDRYQDNFEETPPMSTYLVAFVVSDFIPRGDEDFSVVTREEYFNYTEFSYEVGLRILQAYDDYTKLPYKTLGNQILQKLGSPKFPHNGMENWGLVIYKDLVLVREPGYTDGWADREYTVRILAHETAHMWFGNSVTFAWWSFFWLNEAFARYFEYFMAHQLYPEYQLDQQFVIKQVHLIFGTDAANGTQPLTSPEESVETPSQIANKFSSITYAKGASIVRMIRNVMTPERFDAAIHDYLAENHLKNTRPKQLFSHLKQHWPPEHKNKISVDQFLNDWTAKVGFPIVSIRVLPYRNPVILLRQRRFLLNPEDGSDASVRYTIPISYATNQTRDFETLKPEFFFNESEEMMTWTVENPISWIIVNIQQSGFYRVFYEADLLWEIRKALDAPQHSGIHVINRAQLVDDLLTYGHIGLMEYDDVFQFLEYLGSEVEYLPWYAAFNNFQHISQRLPAGSQQKDFGDFLFGISTQVYNKLGFHGENDTVLDVYNRKQLINWLCKYKHADCNERARAVFDEAFKSRQMLPVDMRETVYCNAVRLGAFSYYNTLKKLYSEEKRSDERELLLRSMGCTLHHVEYHFALILSNQVPRELKLVALKPTYTQNPDNVSPVFSMITKEAERLADGLGGWSSLATVVSDVANYFTTKDQQAELENFIEEKGELFGSSVTTLHNAVKKVEANLEWSELRLGSLVEYLKSAGTVNACSYVLGVVVYVTVHLLYQRS